MDRCIGCEMDRGGGGYRVLRVRPCDGPVFLTGAKTPNQGINRITQEPSIDIALLTGGGTERRTPTDLHPNGVVRLRVLAEKLKSTKPLKILRRPAPSSKSAEFAKTPETSKQIPEIPICNHGWQQSRSLQGAYFLFSSKAKSQLTYAQFGM
jgi:hypothetical protein